MGGCVRCHIPIDSTVGVGSIKWKDEWGRTVGEWGSILREVAPILYNMGGTFLEGEQLIFCH